MFRPTNTLVAGAGYVGGALVSLLSKAEYQVTGLRRTPQSNSPVPYIRADLLTPDSLADVPKGPISVVYCAAAGAQAEEAYRSAYVIGLSNIIELLKTRNQTVERFIFVSSTGVYSQNKGEWITEDSEVDGGDYQSRTLLAGESLVQALPWEHSVVRFGGIYGPGRRYLIRMVEEGRAVRVKGFPIYTNRIHRDDCARMLKFLLELPQMKPLYLGVDNEPADRSEVFLWLAQKLGLSTPQELGWSEEEKTKSGQGKRCSNERIRSEGFSFTYPTYREGYEMMLKP